jgi:hypothetical protein
MSKKVIRLTESELKRYINKVVSEQTAPNTNPPSGVKPEPAPAPRIPLVGGTAAEKLKELVGKAVLCRASDNSAIYKCVIRSATHNKNNVVYLMVSCENDPKIIFIRYTADGDKGLFVGGSATNVIPVTCKGLSDWLNTNIKPYMESYDFAKSGSSNMNADFS